MCSSLPQWGSTRQFRLRRVAESSAARIVRPWIFLALVVLSLSPLAHAELQWQQRRLVLEPAIGAHEVVGIFEFVNRGTQAVRVTDVQSGCGCTVAVLDQDVVMPGEKGRVRATFHVGDRQGRQSVAVTVTAHEPAVRTYDLTLEVVVQEFATVSPRLLHWRVGDDVSSKVFRLTLANGFGFVGAEITSADFSIAVINPSSNTVELTITPRDLWAKRSGTIKIQVAQPNHPPMEITAMVRVL